MKNFRHLDKFLEMAPRKEFRLTIDSLELAEGNEFITDVDIDKMTLLNVNFRPRHAYLNLETRISYSYPLELTVRSRQLARRLGVAKGERLRGTLSGSYMLDIKAAAQAPNLSDQAEPGTTFIMPGVLIYARPFPQTGQATLIFNYGNERLQYFEIADGHTDFENIDYTLGKGAGMKISPNELFKINFKTVFIQHY